MEERIKELFERPTFACRGMITTDMYEELFNWYGSLRVDDITECTIHIDTTGGEVEAGMDIYNIIRMADMAYDIKTTAFCSREVFSAAIVILLACDKRLGLLESRYMIHPVAWNQNIDIPFASNIIEPTEEFMQMVTGQLTGMIISQSQIIRVLMSRANLEEKDIVDSAAKEVWMNAADAQECGLIHEIISL